VCVCLLVCCLLHMNDALDREAPVLWHLLQDNLGKPAPERLNRSDFHEAADDGVGHLASAGIYANHLHLTADR